MIQKEVYAKIVRESVVNEIGRKGEHVMQGLKHVQTNDRSWPMVERKGFKLKKHNLQPLMKEIVEKGPRMPLKHVNTVEKNILSLGGIKRADFQLKKWNTPWLSDIKRGNFKLRHVTQINDKSAPRVHFIRKMNMNPVFNDIKNRHWPQLKHVTQVKDKSKPLIEKDVHLHEWNFGTVLEEVKKPHSLKHVNTQDKAVPAIEKGSHLKKWNKEGLMSEVKKGTKLKHVETVDKTALKLR